MAAAHSNSVLMPAAMEAGMGATQQLEAMNYHHPCTAGTNATIVVVLTRASPTANPRQAARGGVDPATDKAAGQKMT
eukprot:4108897-Pleurochrysis_carterae.AAC.2